MSDGPKNPGISERRLQSRLPVSLLTCVELGEANGGIVVNISEGGLALTAAMKVPAESLTRLRIQLPKSREWIDVNGQIRWNSESRKKAGFRFVDLSENDRKRIEEWVFQESSPRGIEGITTTVLGESTKPRRELRPLSLKSFMPSLPAPGVASERQTTHSNPLADPIAARPAIEKILPQHLPPQRESVSDRQEDSEELISIPDQRLYERQRVKALAFMELGESNGGVILDISEGGASVRAAVALADDYLPRMRFQLPPHKQWIETSGRVVRLDESRTLAGIEFMDLPREASMRISEWIALEASRDESPSGTPTVYDKTARLLETLTVREPEKVIPACIPESTTVFGTPGKIVPSAPQVPAPAPVMAPVRVGATVPVSVPPVPLPVRKPLPKANLESSKITASARAIPAAARPSWGTFTVSVALTALLSFAGAWILAGRIGRDQMLRMIENAPAHKAEPANVAQPQSPPSAMTSSNAPRPNVEIPRPEAKSVMPAAGLPAAGLPSRLVAKASPRRDVAGPPAGSRITSAPGPVSEKTPPQGHGVEPPAANSAAIALEHPPVNPPAQDLGNKPAQTQETALASSNLIPGSQVGSPLAAEAKNASAPLAKLPENAEIIKGAVSVNYSPYPSIRVPPDLKSQASRAGTSLQIGQLLTRVDPVYPEDAERQQIEGTVKLHVIIGREGAVQSVQVINGSPSLAPAAMGALRQWRYKQTLFGGQPIEAEEDVTVVFRMTKLHP